jgi:hypothetical protein
MHFLTFLNLSGYESGKILSWFEAAIEIGATPGARWGTPFEQKLQLISAGKPKTF